MTLCLSPERSLVVVTPDHITKTPQSDTCTVRTRSDITAQKNFNVLARGQFNVFFHHKTLQQTKVE